VSNDHPYIVELAKKYDRTPTQVILAWGMSRGYCVIPKASSDENQQSNFMAKDFELTKEEVAEIIKQLDTQNYLIKAMPDSGVANIFA
jgi:diketogulonate reductase-like aldo/keto reductase